MSNQNVLCWNPLHFTAQVWETSSSVFSIILVWVIEDKNDIPFCPPLSLFFSKVNKSSSHGPSHPSCPPWTNYSMPTFFLDGKPVMGHGTAGTASQGLGRREESLLLAHSTLANTALDVSGLHHHKDTLLPQVQLTTRTSSAEQLSSQWVPACTEAWSYPVTHASLCICLCWASSGFCLPCCPACWHSAEWQPSPPAC